MKLTVLFREFFDSEKVAGLLLVFVTITSLTLANSPISDEYTALWSYQFNGHSLVHWINDGLMTIFFLLIGLELEREIYHGELSEIKNASLPILAAIGGLLLPMGIYLALNFGTPTQSGAGIPMATDIAFAIGILSLLGNRVPSALKVFLIALAVIDDIGAILVIAIFYSTSTIFSNLFISLAILGFLFLLNRLKVYNIIPYIIGGIAMWYFMLHSGVHPTITGVLLAFVIPFGDGKRKSTSFKLQHYLHKPVAFFILPLFAVANTGIVIGDNWQDGLFQPYSLGIILGLVIGKPLGIFALSYLGVKLRLCSLPTGLRWVNIIGAGFLGGIGFTMSIFITLLAFKDPDIVNSSKIAILIASLIAGVIGFIALKMTLTAEVDEDNED